MYCPACIEKDESSSGSDSTFEHSDMSDGNDSLGGPASELPSPVNMDSSSSSNESSSSSESESGPEIWDLSSSESEIDESEPDRPQSQLQRMVCIFLAFFQLCFRISDKAMAHLLTFLSALFHHFSSMLQNAPVLRLFSEGFPRTLYSLRKSLKLQSSYMKYVVCPKCHKLYNESQCVVKVGRETRSLHCNIKFPNHPQRHRRQKCGTELMKKVKIGKNYKLVPRKSYVYYDIIQSLQRLVSKPGFLSLCEQWRKRNVPSGWLTDIYDGKLWKEWMRVGGVPFLEVPGNLVFMLNIDWF